MKRKLERGKKPGLLRRNESGQVLVLVALAAVFLIGMAALAVDISHGLVVRHELQNAADASALAGAGTWPHISAPPWGPTGRRGRNGGIQFHRMEQIGRPISCHLRTFVRLLEPLPKPGGAAATRHHSRRPRMYRRLRYRSAEPLGKTAVPCPLGSQESSE